MSSGVAGTEIALFIGFLNKVGIKNDIIGKYIEKFKLPKAIGSIDKSWFTEKRIEKDHVKAMASEIFSMLQLLRAFVIDVVKPRNILTEHIECLELLCRIIELLQLGPRKALAKIMDLRNAIIDHNALFIKLYPGGIKPKFHHLLHLPEDAEKIGVLLSCFPTERKHKLVKSSATDVFRNFQRTVLVDLVSIQIDSAIDDRNYSIPHLLNEHVIANSAIQHSISAKLWCGEVRAKDICITRDCRIFRIGRFFCMDDQIVIEATPLESGAKDGLYIETAMSPSWIAAEEIWRPLPWAPFREGIVRVCIPLLASPF